MSEAQLQVGQVLAERYWLKELLGRGSVGDVFRARHVRVPREFAVKVLHPHLLADDKTRLRFEREAELAGRLRHRNVAGVVDVGDTAHSRFLVMELAQGPSLASLIHGTPMPTPRALEIVRQICDGLHHAHEHGLVHRDLKPENVIVESVHGRDVPRIVDFGLAILHDSVAEERERLTTTGIVVGTPHYLAPEAARGKVFDRRADLFALGVILYEMLTGVLPFDGTGVDVALANVTVPTPPMNERAPGVAVDPLLEAVTRRLLAKSPEERPATALEVRKLLDLIDEDRAAAAQTLGVASDAPAGPDASTGRDAPANPVPIAPPEPDLSTRELVGLSSTNRGRVLGLVVLLVALGALGIGALVRGGASSKAPAAEEAPIMAPAVAMDVQPGVAKAPPPASEPADTHTIPPPIPIADVASEPPRRRVARPTPAQKPSSPEVAPAVVTSDELVRMYAAVGRELRSVTERRRDLAADDLWQRYRRLRIHDVIASDALRAEAHQLLAEIQRELGRRFGRAAPPEDSLTR